MKIEKYFDKKEGVHKFRARFQLNNKEFYPVADSRKKLLEIVDEIRASEHRKKYELPVAKYSPTLQELFDAHAPKISSRHQRKLFDRVSKKLLMLLPDEIKIIELKKAHFKTYIDARLGETGIKSKQKIKGQTVNRELNTIAAALSAASGYFPELDDYQKFVIPKAEKQNPERTRIVSPDEINALLAELRREKYTRIADEIEFRLETGFRRKEVSALKPEQYKKEEFALRDVWRAKTKTTTPFYPLSKRAAEIIEERLNLGGEYIFSQTGLPVESDYGVIKTIAERLKINYGRFAAGGFVLHDLRRNFASEIIPHTDIKTAATLLGHSKINNTGIYLKTNEKRLTEAVRRASGDDQKSDIIALYRLARRRKISAKEFLSEFKKIARI